MIGRFSRIGSVLILSMCRLMLEINIEMKQLSLDCLVQVEKDAKVGSFYPISLNSEHKIQISKILHFETSELYY